MTIKIKCVKSQMFNTSFYSGAMTFHAVDRQVIPPTDERWNDIFVDGEEAQRSLVKSRVRDMVPYLLNNRNTAFFSALTLIMVPVDGEDAHEGQHYKFISHHDGGDVGDIEIEDDVMLFVADGQHRREAIAQALIQDKTIGKQQVPVILIPFRDTSRTRQLFTDLNLNQQKVSNTLAQSFDTRDPVILVTRRVSNDFDLFRGRVNTQSNSLAKRSPHVVSMNTLVTAHTELLKALYGQSDLDDVSELEDVKDQGLQGSATRDVASKLVEVWQTAYENLPELSKVVTEQLPPGKLRDGPDEDDPWGGYVFAFGIGWQAIALAASKLVALTGPEWKPTLAKCIASVDWRKGHHWNGIAMVGTRVNNTGPGIRATAAYIIEKGGIRDMIKGDLSGLAQRTSRNVEDVQKVATDLEAMFAQLDKSRAAAVPAEQDAPVAKAAAE